MDSSTRNLQASLPEKQKNEINLPNPNSPPGSQNSLKEDSKQSTLSPPLITIGRNPIDKGNQQFAAASRKRMLTWKKNLSLGMKQFHKVRDSYECHLDEAKIKFLLEGSNEEERKSQLYQKQKLEQLDQVPLQKFEDEIRLQLSEEGIPQPEAVIPLPQSEEKIPLQRSEEEIPIEPPEEKILFQQYEEAPELSKELPKKIICRRRRPLLSMLSSVQNDDQIELAMKSDEELNLNKDKCLEQFRTSLDSHLV